MPLKIEIIDHDIPQLNACARLGAILFILPRLCPQNVRMSGWLLMARNLPSVATANCVTAKTIRSMRMLSALLAQPIYFLLILLRCAIFHLLDSYDYIFIINYINKDITALIDTELNSRCFYLQDTFIIKHCYNI